MPWCPNCKEEFVEGIVFCSDCGEKLVDEFSEIQPAEEAEPEFLVTASDPFEADIIEALLLSQQIPVVKKHREAGDYLQVCMGTTNFGIDLFVPADYLEAAKDAVATIQSDQNAAFDEETALLQKKHKLKQRIFTWIILLFFVPGVLGILIFLVFLMFSLRYSM